MNRLRVRTAADRELGALADDRCDGCGGKADYTCACYGTVCKRAACRKRHEACATDDEAIPEELLGFADRLLSPASSCAWSPRSPSACPGRPASGEGCLRVLGSDGELGSDEEPPP